MRSLFRILTYLIVAITIPASARAADATLLRIFLNDGSSVVSFGEYARVGDQVIFSLPIGGPADRPRLQVVTLAASTVNWDRTEQYAASARYEQYVSTRAEDDYRLLSNEVARVLNDIALTTDPQQALAMAEQARRTLADWPRTHYGYRQDDVREIIGLIDEAIARLRGVNANGFELSLVATAPPPDTAAKDPAALPTPRQALDQLMRLASATARVPERMALLQSALAVLNDPASGITTVDATALRRSIEGQIHDEATVDDRYARMSKRLVSVATRAASRAAIGQVQHVLDQIAREDVRLGARRPEVVQSLRATVQAQLDSARRLRLMRDQWTIRRDLYREYQKSIESQVLVLVKAQPLLEAIRKLDGPEPDRLMQLRSRLAGGADRLERLHVIDDLRETHGLLVNAWRFAEHAADERYSAIASGNVNTAWQASSAAAGALMMLSRAQDEIRTRLDPPHLP